MRTILGPDFFDRKTLVVSKELIGKYLVRMMPDPSTKLGVKPVGFMITETEGYFGFNDQASKARHGKTPGNLPMYAEAGTIYVYFTYGMHWMLNIVTEKEEFPAAVLIRGVEFSPAVRKKGVRHCQAARPGPVFRTAGLHLNGPAKLTKFLKIDKKLNTKKLGRASGLWVEDRGVKINPRHIKRAPRVGIAYAGSYAKKPWRFVYVQK